jgi:hypothetical protein
VCTTSPHLPHTPTRQQSTRGQGCGPYRMGWWDSVLLGASAIAAILRKGASEGKGTVTRGYTCGTAVGVGGEGAGVREKATPPLCVLHKRLSNGRTAQPLQPSESRHQWAQPFKYYKKE